MNLEQTSTIDKKIIDSLKVHAEIESFEHDTINIITPAIISSALYQMDTNSFLYIIVEVIITLKSYEYGDFFQRAYSGGI
jgi:hypothetical protein